MFGLTDPSLSAYNSKTAEATKMGLVSSERSFPIDIKTCKIFQNSSKNDATVISEFIKKVDLCVSQFHLCGAIAPKWLKQQKWDWSHPKYFFQ